MCPESTNFVIFFDKSDYVFHLMSKHNVVIKVK